MDKYYQILGKVLSSGKMQSNKKGNIRYLLNVYEGRTKRGKIQGGRNQLVGLLRLYPCEQLPNLF